MSAQKIAIPFGYRSIVMAAAIAAFAMPFTAQAEEAGPKSREEVKKELVEAHKAGTHDMGGQASTVKLPASSSKTTREQVKKELAKAHKEGTHDMGGQASTLNQPASSSKTSREQVEKELAKAHKEGTHDMGGEASPTKR